MITHSVSELDPNPFDLSAAGHRCFHCGAFLQDPAVMWNGNDGQTLYRHDHCVLEWMPGLLRDVQELRGKRKLGLIQESPRNGRS